MGQVNHINDSPRMTSQPQNVHDQFCSKVDDQNRFKIKQLTINLHFAEIKVD